MGRLFSTGVLPLFLIMLKRPLRNKYTPGLFQLKKKIGLFAFRLSGRSLDQPSHLLDDQQYRVMSLTKMREAYRNQAYPCYLNAAFFKMVWRISFHICSSSVRK